VNWVVVDIQDKNHWGTDFYLINFGLIEFILHSDNKENIVYWIRSLVIGDYTIVFIGDDFDIEYKFKNVKI
jgi:hypothetical protein